MTFPTFDWPAAGEFINRADELERLSHWWNSDERMPLNVFGRRRAGKSWLLRRFAHSRSAVFLQAERIPAGAQLTEFTRQLGDLSGSAESLQDVPSLFKSLYRIGQKGRILAVIDEFPWLLPDDPSHRERVLSGIQAVMENERDSSQLKLIVCGSAVDQMEALQKEKNPLYGRLIPLEIKPLNRRQAGPFLEGFGAVDALTRYGVAGGMPRYLKEIASASLQDVISEAVLKPTAPLWNEGRTIIEQELPDPDVHMAILDQLAHNVQGQSDLGSTLGMSTSEISRYLKVLEDMRLIRRRLPLGAQPNYPKPQWNLEDPFLKFWFRFVYPFQRDLESGLDPSDLWTREIEPNLAHHVSPLFEEESRVHTRSHFGHLATHVGSWWGKARHDLRQDGSRTSEEIDIVGVRGKKVQVVGEAKWTNSPMPASILGEIREFKIPALGQDGFSITDEAMIVLYSRSGYGPLLKVAADNDPTVVLVDPAAMLEVHHEA